MDEAEQILLYEIDKKVTVCATKITAVEEHMREQNGYIRENTEWRLQRRGQLTEGERIAANMRNWLIVGFSCMGALGLGSIIAAFVR